MNRALEMEQSNDGTTESDVLSRCMKKGEKYQVTWFGEINDNENEWMDGWTGIMI